MNWYVIIILAYLIALTIYNIWKSKAVHSQEDMMVAGRSLGVTKMVFTLVCTWIGSGTFIAGAEYAYHLQAASTMPFTFLTRTWLLW